MSKNLAQKTRKTGIIASALMIPLVFMIFSPSMITSHATTPTLVTGVATATDQVTTVIGASGNFLYLEVTSVLTYTGGLVGSGPAVAFATIDTSTGMLVFAEQSTFTGTVMGSQTGTVTVLTTGTGTLGGSSQAQVVLIHGAGGLAGLHGEGSITSSGLTTSYSIRVHFDPS